MYNDLLSEVTGWCLVCLVQNTKLKVLDKRDLLNHLTFPSENRKVNSSTWHKAKHRCRQSKEQAPTLLFSYAVLQSLRSRYGSGYCLESSAVGSEMTSHSLSSPLQAVPSCSYTDVRETQTDAHDSL